MKYFFYNKSEKKVKIKTQKMLNKILTIFTLIVLMKSAFSLNSTDLCSSSTCNGIYNYKCTKDLCSTNKAKCHEYLTFQRSHTFSSLNALLKLNTKIPVCESFDMNTNKFCIRNTNCFQQKSLWTKSGLRTVKQKANCKCEGKHTFECNDYCTLDEEFCIALNMKSQQRRLKKRDIEYCMV